MLEKFSEMCLSDKTNIDDITVNMKKMNLVNDVKRDELRFIHANDVIMVSGNYKGYVGWVYERNPRMVSLKYSEEFYVYQSNYGKKFVGDVIKTLRGDAVILSNVDSLYNVLVDGMELRLPKNCFKILVCFKNQGVKKVGVVMEQMQENFKIKNIQNFYNVNCENTVLIENVIDYMKRDVCVYGDELVISKNDIMDSFYVVCNKIREVDYTWRYGKLRYEIPAQYYVSKSDVYRLNGSDVIIMDDMVRVRSGKYKNMIGSLVKVDPVNLSVHLSALDKKISQHMKITNVGNYYMGNIYESDVFYMDFKLKSGNYFQVDKCYGDVFIGKEYIKTSPVSIVDKTITKDMISVYMSGFKIFEKNTKVELGVESQEMLYLSDEHDQGNAEEDEEGDNEDAIEKDYGNGNGNENENDQEVEEQYESKEGEMKQTFKDIERSMVMNRAISKEEREYLKLIEKCISALGGVFDKFIILDKVIDVVNVMKGELLKIGIDGWCKIDTLSVSPLAEY